MDNNSRFDKIMETITEVDKKWFVGGLFIVFIIANLLGF